MSVNSKMKAIADKIRAIRGTTGTMGLDAMATNLGTVQTNITSAFTSVGNKGGTVPTSKVIGNLASAIDSIPEGVELNFEVVGGTSKPSNPKENTIWVKTEKIGAWYFSATQPEGLQEWDVWFTTGTTSLVEFDALKKNGIQVYPISAKQYASGALVSKVAYLYKNGESVLFSEEVFYLFSAERGINEGTWNKKTLDANIGKFSVDSQKVYLYSKEDNTTYAMVAVNNEPINTAGKSKLIVSMSVSGNVSSTSAFGLSTSPTNTTYNSAMVATKKLGNGDLELDITTLNETYYFKVWLNSSGSAYTATCTITEIKTV